MVHRNSCPTPYDAEVMNSRKINPDCLVWISGLIIILSAAWHVPYTLLVYPSGSLLPIFNPRASSLPPSPIWPCCLEKNQHIVGAGKAHEFPHKPTAAQPQLWRGHSYKWACWPGLLEQTGILPRLQNWGSALGLASTPRAFSIEQLPSSGRLTMDGSCRRWWGCSSQATSASSRGDWKWSVDSKVTWDSSMQVKMSHWFLGNMLIDMTGDWYQQGYASHHEEK